MRPFHPIPATLAIVAAMLISSGCGQDYSSNSYGGNPPPASTPPNTVLLSGMSFAPRSITISAGTTLTWRNQDAYLHTSTADGGAWDTGDIPGGASRTTTFNTPGTYPYHCAYHGTMGMTGTVIVQ